MSTLEGSSFEGMQPANPPGHTHSEPRRGMGRAALEHSSTRSLGQRCRRQLCLEPRRAVRLFREGSAATSNFAVRGTLRATVILHSFFKAKNIIYADSLVRGALLVKHHMQ